MNLQLAQTYAAKIAAWIAPQCEAPPIIVGSIRRLRPECADVDIVCIPKLREERDLFGDLVGKTNLLHNRFVFEQVGGKLTIISGLTEGDQMTLDLRKCQLDLWFATPETLATRTLCRTGSKEHNIWLAQRAQNQGKKWSPYKGVYDRRGNLVPAKTEDDIYAALDLPIIDPVNRELSWLIKHFGP